MTPKQQRFVAEYLTKPDIQTAIETAQAKRARRTRIDADWVILRAVVELVERCMQNEPVYDAHGEPTGKYRFDSAGAARGIALLAKHTGGFSARVEHSGPDGAPVPAQIETVVRFVAPT